MKRKLEPQYYEPDVQDEVWVKDENGELVEVKAGEEDAVEARE